LSKKQKAKSKSKVGFESQNFYLLILIYLNRDFRDRVRTLKLQRLVDANTGGLLKCQVCDQNSCLGETNEHLLIIDHINGN
jgi:hypothetical protein